MGLFERLRPNERTPGTAIVRASERIGRGEVDAGSSDPLNIALDHFGSRRYALLLEVRLEGREPYQLDGEWKVPNRVLGSLGGGGVLAEGIELPVHVGDDQSEVQIDWDAYRAKPGRKDELKAAQGKRQSAAKAEQVARNPKLQQKLWAQGAMKAQAWAGAVRSGAMSLEEFERNLSLDVDQGRMNPADAEAARKSLQ